ncbi:putative RNA polymerase sigma-D factor [Rhizocola hellebori]|uniref:Putative RNA polymerase sigma-D factor n=1 Tax=Rhizocola hellebori TaxID=1392758 RepID=A0A8J3VG07_9ACTN|nr:putative RNA polymerase sigma-D factor [Rhizocola hellebori]
MRGEPDAMAALLGNVQPGVIKYCRARLGKTGGAFTTADDVSQEVCVALLKALPRYRHQGVPFSAFVYGIAARKVTDAQRAAMKLAVPAAEATFERPDAAPGPEQQAVSADQAKLLNQLLDHLPETQREIVVLRVAVGLSADEVGSVLNMTSVAVRVAQSRALAKLRNLAAGIFDEPMERRAV